MLHGRWRNRPRCSDRTSNGAEQWLEDNKVRPIRMLLTHAHIDHVMGCAWVKERYGLLPEVHRKDLPMQMATQSGAMFGVACDPVPLRRISWKKGR